VAQRAALDLLTGPCTSNLVAQIRQVRAGASLRGVTVGSSRMPICAETTSRRGPSRIQHPNGTPAPRRPLPGLRAMQGSERTGVPTPSISHDSHTRRKDAAWDGDPGSRSVSLVPHERGEAWVSPQRP
jgi:hypothetical protein